jgi:hypothetical protein
LSLSGIYHGVNPGMGWPLAVSAALMDRAPGSLFKALGRWRFGHLMAMAAILLPFTALMVSLVNGSARSRSARLPRDRAGGLPADQPAASAVSGRVRPRGWRCGRSCAAMAHGAGLMLVPIYLGICMWGAL